MTRLLIGLWTILLTFCSCSDKESKDLRRTLSKEYASPQSIKKLPSGSKAQYILMEKNINQQYVKELDSLINTGFERQLERFEDQELGVLASYGNMFSWLFKSKQSWEEELKLKSSKYFNTLDLEQEQNALYIQYIGKIKNLRQQFVSSQQLPQYTQFDLPPEEISLTAFSAHSRNNIGIEMIGELLGSKIFSWLLGFFITWLLVTVCGLPAGPPGWLISLLTIVIMLGVSWIMSSRNDSKLMEQLRVQHQETNVIDSKNLLDKLDNNTLTFYEQF